MSSEQTQREKFEAYAQGRPWLQLHRDEDVQMLRDLLRRIDAALKVDCEGK